MDEFELERTNVIVDVDKLVKSNIKYISIPLNRFIEWECWNSNTEHLSKNDMYIKCLSVDDAEKAKSLSKIYCSSFWNYLENNTNNDNF